MQLPEVLHHNFLFARCSSLNSAIPYWWIPFDVELREETKHSASLALVCSHWAVPSRRALLRTVTISFGLRQSESLSQLLHDHEYARLALRRLIVDIPPNWERMSDHLTASRLQFIVMQSPRICELHIDNAPSSLIMPEFLQGLASLQFRSDHEFRASMRRTGQRDGLKTATSIHPTVHAP